jgi:CheY-like chemotaxis protein
VTDPRNGLDVLVADDEAVPRAMLVALLSPVANELAVATSGDEAVAQFRQRLELGRPFRLVFLDMLMPPGIDGRTALAQIRAAEAQHGLPSRARAKVLMATGVDDIGEVMGAYYQECDDYLVKPISARNLFPALHKLGIEARPDPGATLELLTELLRSTR